MSIQDIVPKSVLSLETLGGLIELSGLAVMVLSAAGFVIGTIWVIVSPMMAGFGFHFGLIIAVGVYAISFFLTGVLLVAFGKLTAVVLEIRDRLHAIERV
ncbi:MAG: hypothetical protein JJ896_14280 [Rhodothermales bacterium]|nr:hypothetical protein [Rhodothermales bacterium]MBO6780817.1 hypothetical protein [Rhodothermales bacterium]